MKPEKGSALYNIRHSLAHMLAEAVLDMFPEAKLGTGPVTENGFYYDFELPRPLIPEDLPLLQKRMKKYVQQGQNFVRRDEPIKESIAFLKTIKQPFKIDLVNKFVEQQGIKSVSFYENFIPQKEEPVFVDLCEGGHVENTKEIDPKSFKLSHISAAYWQADDSNASMQRIYGVSFETAEELAEYEKMMIEAKKRDHRKLGTELELFTFSESVGSGLPMFYPKGEIIKHELEKYMREEKEKLGYSFVEIPHIAKRALYEKSGHMGKYDAMMPVMKDNEDHEFVMKAMNCPHHFELYSSLLHSYRDLPLRYAENTTCYRNEKSGELSGLTRVKALTQDDTHHFVRHDQIQSEIEMILGLMERTYNTFGFEDFKVDISIRDPENKDKYFGEDELWNKAEKILIESVEKWGAPFTVEEGEAAFYGPKIDIQVKDAIGRKWQLTTVQLDFIQPENFDMTYIGEDGEKHRPAVLHVAILGSSHRFMGVAIEHFAGAFPTWLAPVQVQVIPVAAPHEVYAIKVRTMLRDQGVRAKILPPDESLGKRIRYAEKQKIPYMLVIGDKEAEAGEVNVRSYKTKEEAPEKLEDFVERVCKEISSRSL